MRSRIQSVVATVTLIVSVPLSVSVPALPGTDRSVDVQGHRGAAGLRPENTLPAFEHSIALGVATLELDLQVTRDRVLIVAHDPHLGGFCRRDDGGSAPGAPFRELDLADLAEIDCGSQRAGRFPEQQPVPGARVPTFRQVLRLARDAERPVRINAEIKLGGRAKSIPVDKFAALVVDLLNEEEMATRTMVQSFHVEALRAVAEIAPEIDLGILVRGRGSYDSALEESGATTLLPKHGALQEDDVRRMQARGIAVIPWTVNKPEAIRRILAMGVDGIISDYPDRVIAILAE